MKILILSAQPPSPYSGGEIRLLNLIKHLSDKHEFTVMAPVHSLDDPSAVYANGTCNFHPILIPQTKAAQKARFYYFLNAWKNVLLDEKPYLARVFYSPNIQEEILGVLNRNSFDIIQAQQLLMAQYVPHNTKSPTVLDIDNLWTKLIPRLFPAKPDDNFTGRLIQPLEQIKVRNYERKIINQFDACLAISPEEELQLKTAHPGKLIALVPNGVDIEEYSPRPMEQHSQINFVFSGTMEWEPNSQAVLYFSERILPRIWDRFPNAKFQIVGRNPPPAVQNMAQDSRIEVTGFVKDVRPYIDSATIFVVPLLAGAGTRLKILEAFALAKSVVSTSIGAEGLNAVDGEHLCIANTPHDFAARLLELIENPEMRSRLGNNGRQLVETSYDWKRITKQLDQVYEALC